MDFIWGHFSSSYLHVCHSYFIYCRSPVFIKYFNNNINLNLYLILTGLSDCVVFEKTLSLLKNPEEKAVLSCSHNDKNLDVMLWYKQINTSLILIGYGYDKTDPVYEPEMQKKFEMTRKDTVTGGLVISNLVLSDSAVYYCAAKRHSVTVSVAHLSKSWSNRTGNTHKCINSCGIWF